MSDKRLKGLNATMSQNSGFTSTTKDYMREKLQQKADYDWQFASDIFTISKVLPNKTFSPIEVRLTLPYKIASVSTIKDDFRVILFKDLSYVPILGDLWNFNGYYWMTTDIGSIDSPTSSCMVQKCSDALRFYDENGVYHSLPCIINKSLIYNLDDDKVMALPSNKTHVLTQWNTESKLIKWADVMATENKYTRFLLNEYAFRTVAIDRSSYIRNNNGYLDIELLSDMLNINDDKVNNIADGLNVNVKVDIQNGASIVIQNGTNLQLNTVVTKDNIVVNNPIIEYISSDSLTATVSSNGLVNGISVGNVVITANYGNVSDSINVEVSAVVTDNYTMEYSSSINNITSLKLSQSETITVVSKNNGIPYSDTIVFSLTDITGLLPTNLVTIVSTVNNVITIKAVNDAKNVGKKFRLYASGNNVVGQYIDVVIKSIF